MRLAALGAGLSWRHRLAGALTGLVVLSLLTQLRDVLGLPSQMLLYLVAVVAVAVVGGLLPALATTIAAAVLLDQFFIPPLNDFAVADPDNVVDLVAFVLVAAAASSVVGLTACRREAEVLVTASAEGPEELCRLAEEQAALRRVATLVARAVSSEEVFAAVTAEVGRLLGADLASMVRYDPDGAATWLGAWSGTGTAFPISVGDRVELRGRSAATLVFETGRPARIDDYSGASGPVADVAHAWGVRATVGAPISVEGRLWGVMVVSSARAGPLPADTEARLAGFAELVATAIANAESRAHLEESRDALRRIADEQAALRRVATLVARGGPPAEIFAAVAREVGSVLGADGTLIVRLDPDDATTVIASVGNLPDKLTVGRRWKPEPPMAMATVLRTGHPARNDDYSQAPGEVSEIARRQGIRSGVAVPIVVEGRLWGGAIGTTTRRERFPADSEERMAGFTELIGTALANADSRTQLTASLARIVAAADDARRRIERDLHDGTQQRLVALRLALSVAQSSVPAELPELRTQLGRVADELTATTRELCELARGIHPAILSERGLCAALRTLARRAAVPVELDIQIKTRPPDPIEVAAYYLVSEALTNTAKHARASHVQVTVEQRNGLLHLSIRDDGVGGADPAAGSGLTGLRDRVQALGGSIEVTSRRGEGTAIVVELPLRPH
jgi:signal transduction histidine kinase